MFNELYISCNHITYINATELNKQFTLIKALISAFFGLSVITYIRGSLMRTKLILNSGRALNVSYKVLHYSTDNIKIQINFCATKDIKHNELLGAYIDTFRIEYIKELTCKACIAMVLDGSCN